MEKIVWGIIGCGDVAERKSGPAFNLIENSSLLAVMRRDKAKAEDFAKRHKVPIFFDNAESVVNHKDINSVYIATPPSTHLNYALDVLKANKNVYLEKPMVLNSSEAKQLKQAVSLSTGKLTVAHYRRQLPMFLKVKAILEERAIGTVTSIELNLLQSRFKEYDTTSNNWRINPSISGGGYFHDLAPHQLDLLIDWFGMPIEFSGHSSSQISDVKIDTKVEGTIQFKHGITCHGFWDFNVDEHLQKDECIISGNKGSMSFALFGDEVSLTIEGNTETLKFQHPKHIQQPMIQKTVDYFLGNTNNPCSVEEGIVGINIIDEFTT